jgi:DNA-binding beta-propeller fold protein YncE
MAGYIYALTYNPNTNEIYYANYGGSSISVIG